MKCKACKRQIDDDSIYCKFCGEKQIRERRKKTEIKVPAPKQLPSGTWFGRITVSGQRVSISATSEAEYYAKARAAKAGLIKVAKSNPTLTVGQAIDTFINDNANILSPSTIKGYLSYRRCRFQSIMDQDVSSVKWQAAINAEYGTGISPKMLANSWRLITGALKYHNVPLPTVTLPKVQKSERPWLDYEQITMFLGLINETPCELPALLALHSLRRSELMDLELDDIDFKKEIIHVRGASVYDKNGKFIHKEENKNVSSRRDVPFLIPRLKEILLRCEPGKLIAVKPNTPYKQINRVCEENDLPLVGIHGLRHSFASLAYHLGWSEATTMAVGGWSDSKVVHEIYTHLANQDKNKDVERMREYYVMSGKTTSRGN